MCGFIWDFVVECIVVMGYWCVGINCDFSFR